MANVHKDFHGCLSYALRFLEKELGWEGVDEFLRRVARTVYSPLVEALKRDGLIALELHWRRIMEIENANFEIRHEQNTLVLVVRRCPAIHHLRMRGYAVYDKFCETTRIINEEICRNAGYVSSINYDQESGSCTQRFWKAPQWFPAPSS